MMVFITVRPDPTHTSAPWAVARDPRTDPPLPGLPGACIAWKAGPQGAGQAGRRQHILMRGAGPPTITATTARGRAQRTWLFRHILGAMDSSGGSDLRTKRFIAMNLGNSGVTRQSDNRRMALRDSGRCEVP